MVKTNQGYYRFPDVCGETVCFVSEDDLWIVSRRGGAAHRLTANLAAISNPKISPDGKWIAFCSGEEGPREIYIMDIRGGNARRMTFFGRRSVPLGWTADSQNILFYSNFEQPYDTSIYQLSLRGGEPRRLPVGYANRIAFGAKGMVIGRHVSDASRWKRYRGGTAGEIWIDREGTGSFKRLLKLNANLGDPMWIGRRIYFLSDHEGIGNIYSCTLTGKDLKRHTDHQTFYARNAGTDGKTLVYHAGADLYALDIRTDRVEKIEIEYRSSFTQTNRKFVDASDHLQGFDLSADGNTLAMTIRGKPVTFENWHGPVRQWGQREGARYRLPTWLQDGKHLVFSSDQLHGENKIYLIHGGKHSEEILWRLDIGIVHQMVASPRENKILATNHRNELLLIDCLRKRKKVLDRSPHSRITDPTWSPDGKWAAYSYHDTPETSIIKVCRISSGKCHPLVSPVRHDYSPCFSPDGKYLFFIGDRKFHPEYDSLQFELSFMESGCLYTLPLRKDVGSPFCFEPDDESRQDKKGDDDKKRKFTPVQIDFKNIEQRLIRFPVPPGLYRSLAAHDKKVFYLRYPRLSSHDEDDDETEPTLKAYNFEKQEEEQIVSEIIKFRISLKGDKMILRKRDELFVVKVGEKPKDNTKHPYSPESGEIDLFRARVEIDRRTEWEQMYREAWLLQREHFWNQEMSGVDWLKVYKRYLPLLKRVGSRGEFSDLIWEMQGELGTSHCYELGGDYREGPFYDVGHLGCTYRKRKNVYEIKDIWYGDSSRNGERSPLLTPGVDIRPGDSLLAINGRPINAEAHPRELLVDLGDQEVSLTIRRPGGQRKRHVVVTTLEDEFPLLYRAWVEKNRAYVHRKSRGKIGYVHIPDMLKWGFAEFHRYYLVECQYDALVVDLRYNRGGHISQLLLEKLNRKRLGYDVTRWARDPVPYPEASVAGPLVAITNQFAGSDGDIFCHSFKLMKLGKLVGKRTWGGVIGISTQYSLVDGAITTQPEYSFWFKDVGWGVENYGVSPDVDVDITPSDYERGIDTQLDKGIKILLDELKKHPVQHPEFGDLPTRRLPRLPQRISNSSE